MTGFWIAHFREVVTAAGALFVVGLYGVLATHNMLRIVIGLELLTKSVTLLLVFAGAVTGRTATAQVLAITLVVVEVVVIAVAAGIVVGAHQHARTVSTDVMHELEG